MIIQTTGPQLTLRTCSSTANVRSFNDWPYTTLWLRRD